ncbi:MAG: hypothetical protein ACC656_12065, partial [Candidatus Heimdallarchaeota archaeon]
TEFSLEKSKLVLIFIALLIIATMSVVSIILLPDLLALSGIEISGLPDPSTTFVLADYWGDLTLYIFITILYGMGIFSSEIDNNKPIYFKLSRPVSRRSYYLIRSLIRIVGFFIISTLTSLYVYFFSSLYFDTLDLASVILSSVIISLSLVSFLSVVIMASAKFRTLVSDVIGISFFFFQILTFLFQSAFEWLKWINPLSLSTIWKNIIGNIAESGEILTTIVALCIWIIVPTTLGLLMFVKRDI